MIHFHYKSKNINHNETVKTYNTKGGKLLFIPHITTTHFGTESLRYNSHLTWNNFSQSINSNNFYNVWISKSKNFLKDLLSENIYNIQYEILVIRLYDLLYLYMRTNILLSLIHQICSICFVVDIPFYINGH